MNAKYKIILRRVTIILIIFVLMWLLLPFQQVMHSVVPASKTQISWMYEMDKNMLVSVADYLQESGYHKIYIDDADYGFNDKKSGYLFALNTNDSLGRFVLEDQQVQRDINILFKLKGYSIIGKDGNTIYFLISTAGEHNKGIAYTIDGEPPVLDFVVDYELLSEEGHWYYYEENFEKEYRLRVLIERMDREDDPLSYDGAIRWLEEHE